MKIAINRKSKGIFCIISAAFCFAMMAVFVRASGDVPVFEKSFFRNLVAFVIAGAMLIKQKQPPVVEKRNILPLIARSVFGTVGLMGNFYAIDHLVLSDATMLNKLSPFFALIFSIFILKEKVRPSQAIAIGIAFFGSLLIIKPGFESTDIFASAMGLLGGFGAGLAYTFVRFLGKRGVKGAVIVFYFSLCSCFSCLPFVIYNFKPLEPFQFAMLILAGVAAAGGQFSITAAYTYAPAREIAVYDYTQVIFSALLGWALFAQIPDAISIVGYIVIIGASIGSFVIQKKDHERLTDTG